MRATAEAIERAVLQLLAAHGGASEGIALRYRALQEAWPRMALRRTDLVEGVKRLVFAGELRMQRSEGESCVALTAAGAQRCRSAGAPPAQIARIAQLIRQLAPARPAHELPHRRRDDPPAPAP